VPVAESTTEHQDLTGILLPAGLSVDEARALVSKRGLGDVVVRVLPLPSLQLLQIEVHSARDGLPCEDPELVGLLAKASPGGRGVFLHVNHTSKQALLHPFLDGEPGEGFAGEPGSAFEAKLLEAIGRGPLAAITGADDGSRLGIGVASSSTVAEIRGRRLAIPAGMPTDLGSFDFHDGGLGLGDGTRLAFFAFDRRTAATAWAELPAAELAAVLTKMPPARFGPLAGLVAAEVAELAALGTQTLAASQSQRLRLLELLTLGGALIFSAGESVAHWDERVLPLLHLASDDPVIDADELDELAACDGVLHALAEVLPTRSPPGGEGSLLAFLGDDEVGPLAPWATAGEEYHGAIFTLRPGRLLDAVRALDSRRLGTAVQKLEDAWYHALHPDAATDEGLAEFARQKDLDSQPDSQRFLRAWAELRVVLELAALNHLDVGLLFYEPGVV